MVYQLPPNVDNIILKHTYPSNENTGKYGREGDGGRCVLSVCVCVGNGGGGGGEGRMEMADNFHKVLTHFFCGQPEITKTTTKLYSIFS